MGGAILDFLFGLEHAESLRSADLSFEASWAASAPAWVLFGCIAMAVVGLLSYLRFERRIRRHRRVWLAVLRAGVLALMFFFVAGPILEIVYRETPQPLVYLLFDGTESMGIRDRFDSKTEQALRDASGLAARRSDGSAPSRMEYLQALLRKSDDNLVEALNRRCRLRAFVVDRQGIRPLKVVEKADGEPDGAFMASKLDAKAHITPLGEAIEDLAVGHKRDNLGAVVIFSDFNKNSGVEPLAPAGRLGRPIHTVGFGPVATKDLSVTISASPVLKKAERERVIVALGQSQLAGQSATVRVLAEPLDAEGKADATRKAVVVGEKSVTLRGPRTIVEFPFVPEDTGRFQLVARADPMAGESVEENNKTTREINVRDDFMRLLYVSYEPSWEWRFIKEVFHRDKLVGMRGFRTFLHVSDPEVRQTNPLFLPRLDAQRSEFFVNDVIFLGDMPAEVLTSRFCEMVKEFVGTFGGGLVIISGPIYGPGRLAETPLADMLPVEIDPKAGRRDAKQFLMQLTPAAANFSFTQLGNTPEENKKAWENMGPLPWYQPSRKVHPLGQVLAEHPTDTCSDGKTPQPIIAARRYGKGEVIYLAFDETWRLRRLFGEKFYRQFWGQMIYRLGLGHSVGSQKRFIVRTDRTRYQVDDELRLTVEALDEEFRPLTRDKLPGGKLELAGELIVIDEEGKTRDPRPIRIPVAHEARGQFELSMPLLTAGDYRIRIEDHVTGDDTEVVFAVTSVSAERQSAVRNIGLEEALARATKGKVYDLTSVGELPDQLEFSAIQRTSVKPFHLASTPLCFGLLVLLAVGEWALRKWTNVP